MGLFEFQLYLNKKEIDFLLKYDFYKEIKHNDIEISHDTIFLTLSEKGFIHNWECDGTMYCQGTCLYKQFISKYKN